MIAEALPEQGYASYRKTLQQLIGIPLSANDLEIHTLIAHGFPASTLLDLVAAGLIPVSQRNQIISLRALNCRAEKGQLLSSLESDRLFTYAHIFSISQAVFGCQDKALRWLHKPRKRFIGKTPAQMLSTLCGLNQVELMLMQITEGYAF